MQGALGSLKSLYANFQNTSAPAKAVPTQENKQEMTILALAKINREKYEDWTSGKFNLQVAAVPRDDETDQFAPQLLHTTTMTEVEIDPKANPSSKPPPFNYAGQIRRPYMNLVKTQIKKPGNFYSLKHETKTTIIPQYLGELWE